MPSEFSASRLGPNLRLESHPEARDKCVAGTSFAAGAIIVSVSALADVLLPSEKSHRCDACHSLASPGSVALSRLRRCTGCASFWYCNTSSSYYSGLRPEHALEERTSESLEDHKKMDALLLSNLVACISCTESSTQDESSSVSTFLSLLSGTRSDPAPPICTKSAMSEATVDALYSRFDNNNFSMHSHFNTYGHGVFPLASRLFNHSCVPNAAVKYIICSSKPVTLEVVALRAISQREEICIPYLDPALLQTRATILELTYRFTCQCQSCTFLRALGKVPEPPEDESELKKTCKLIQDYVESIGESSPLIGGDSAQFPQALLCTLNESFIGTVAEKFSAASHGGSYDAALDMGRTLTALYRLIYPLNYPQIGLHLLERTKTAWNCLARADVVDGPIAQEFRQCLASAGDILHTLGAEGDLNTGPLTELRKLMELERTL